MNFRHRKISVSLFYLLAWIILSSPLRAELSFSLNGQVRLQADTIEYLRDQNIVMAKGQVHIQQDKVNLYADSIRYDVTAQEVEAKGHVVWQSEADEIEANSLNYNLKTREGKAYNIKTTSPPWISTGSEIDIKDQKIIIKDAVTTTCDYPEGYRHFYMKTGKITIYSGDYLVAENVVLYIGKVPVFYFPFFVRTIHDLKTPFSVSTGQTDYLGNYVLLTESYLFNPTSYGALYTDYFFKKGLGLGVRHELGLNEYSALSLYGYGIDEKDTHRLRWESRARGLWAFSSNFQGRLEVDYPEDGMFSQDYSVARRDPSLVSTYREYDLSATLTRLQYTFSFLLRRQENPDFSIGDTTETHFTRSLQSLPQFNFNLFPQRLIGRNWLKWDLSLSGDHTYTLTDGYYVNHLTGEVGVGQSAQLFQTQTLFSRIAMNENFQDKPDLNGTNSGETHTLDANNTWTARWTEYATSTLGYTFNQKLDNIRSTDPPHGITSNLLTGAVEFLGGSLFRIRSSTSYDFNIMVGTEASRLTYFRQEIYITPSPLYNYLAIMDYSIQDNAVKDINSVINLKSPRDMWRFMINGNYVDPNVSNIGYFPSPSLPTFQVGGEVDFAFFTNYRLALIENYDVTNAKYITRSLSIYRDLHDWEAQISYTEDPNSGKQLYFTLNLKAFPGRPISVSAQQLQQINSMRNQGLTGAASQFQ